MKKVISVFVVLFLAHISQAAVLQLNPNGMSAQTAQRAQSFLSEVEGKLPAQIKAKLANQNISVQFTQLDNENKVVIPQCDNVVDSIVEAKGTIAQYAQAAGKRQIRYNKQVQSVTNKNSIALNSNFLNVILAGESKAQTYGCDHKNTYRLAQGALINGIARIYDASTKNQISGNLQYKFMAGWNAKKLMQSFWPRAVNPYEYAGTPADHFALNVEFYTLDSEYACRRPLLQNYLAQQVGAVNLTRNCEINTELPLPYEYVQKNIDEKTGIQDDKTLTDLRVYDLNPDKVYNVYYMKASSGQGIGGFGHSMFRVVVCPPHMSVSKECDKILDNDLVFNPRANPNEMRLDNMKGLFGGYASQFLVNSMYELMEEYGDNELRHLFNMPLGQKNAQGQFEEVMTKDQKEKFIYAALESYWAYYGNYKFISNNCADEAMRLYQMTSSDPAVLKLGVLKPNDVNKKLSKLGYIDDREVRTYEKTPGLIAKLFGAGKIKNQKEYDERRALIEAARYDNAFVSKIYNTEDAIRAIMKLEGNPNPNFKEARKEIKKWLNLATPDFEWADEDEAVGMEQMTEEQKKEVLKNTFFQIKSRYENLMARAKTQEEKNLIVLHFYRVMFYIYNKRAEQVGNNAVQIAYAVAYPSKDRKVKEMPKDINVTREQFEIIRTALDNYTEAEMKLMPYKETSVKAGYGIPLKADVVRGEEYLALKDGETEMVKDIIKALGPLLGPEQVLLAEIGCFHDQLKAVRLNSTPPSCARK